ncbi:MAG: hypothetical protein K6L76_04945 [Agarilytica sp.]
MKTKAVLFLSLLLSTLSLSVFSATSHNPIVISSNSDFTAANGVTSGSGTSADPYIISGWEITSGSICISISNTTAFFTIQDNLCHNNSVANATIRTGFSFNGVSNGSVSSNKIYEIYGATATSMAPNGGDATGILLNTVTNFTIDNKNYFYAFTGGTGYLGTSGRPGGRGGSAYGINASGTNSALTISSNYFGQTDAGLNGGNGGAGGPGLSTGGAGGTGGYSFSIYLDGTSGSFSTTTISDNDFTASYAGTGGAGALGSANGNGGAGGTGGLQLTVLAIGNLATLDISKNTFTNLSAGTGALASAGTVSGGNGGRGGDGGMMVPIYLNGNNSQTSDISISDNTIGTKIYAGNGGAGNIGATGTVGGNGGNGGSGGSAAAIVVTGMDTGKIDGNIIKDIEARGGGVAGIGETGVTRGGNGGNGGRSGAASGIVATNLSNFTITENQISDLTGGAGAVGSEGAYATAGYGGNGGSGADGGEAIAIWAVSSPSISITNNQTTSIVAGVGAEGANAGTGAGFDSGGNGGNGGDSGSATAILVNSSSSPTVSNNTIDTVTAGALAGKGANAAAPYYSNTGGNGGNGGNATGIYFDNSSNPTYTGNTYTKLTAASGNKGGYPNGTTGTDGAANNVVTIGTSVDNSKKKKWVCKLTEAERRKQTAISEDSCKMKK